MAEDLKGKTSWETKLKEICDQRHIREPTWMIESERRGKITAYTVIVDIYVKMFRARYFYYGNKIQNAREDAAELACIYLEQHPEVDGIIRRPTDE